MEQGKEWFKFFKFYLDWYEVLKELPDKDRLATFDVLFQSAKDVIEGREPATDNGKISPLLKGWLNVALTTIKDDVHKAKNIRQRNSEGGKKAMRNRWGEQPEPEQSEQPEPEPEQQEYTEDIATKELKDLRNMFARKPSMVKAFCENTGITCVNAYFALCFVFIRNYLGSGNPPHKDANDIYSHFTGWYITTCKDGHTQRRIEKSAQDEFALWNKEFPQGNVPFDKCNIAEVCKAYIDMCRTEQ